MNATETPTPTPPNTSARRTSFREVWQAFHGASEKQVKYLLYLASQRNMTADQLAELCRSRFELTDMDKLTKKQASQMIDEFLGKAEQKVKPRAMHSSGD